MEDISEGAEADEREFLSRSHLGCHDNVYLQVINQDDLAGQDGKKEWTKDLGFLQQVLETGLKSQIQNLTGEKPLLQLRSIFPSRDNCFSGRS